MTFIAPKRRRWQDPWIEDSNTNRPAPTAETNDPKIRKLLGPNGETLRTFSNKPPVGFHQGERTQPPA